MKIILIISTIIVGIVGAIDLYDRLRKKDCNCNDKDNEDINKKTGAFVHDETHNEN